MAGVIEFSLLYAIISCSLLFVKFVVIYDSVEWKARLLRIKRRLLFFAKSAKHCKGSSFFTLRFDEQLLLSSVIIRKLVESGKLSDEADTYTIPVKQYRPLRNICLMHHHIEDGDYDFTEPSSLNVKGNDLCNWIIHSYVYSTYSDIHNSISGFFVSSDYTSNRFLIDE